MGNVPVIDGVCPPNWGKFGEKCYLQSPTVSMSRANCISYCASLTPPARLPCINNPVENADVVSASSGQWIWLGLNDIETEGSFKWMDNCQSTYFKWGSGEPNEGVSGEDIVQMLRTAGTWYTRLNDVQCLCEIFAIGRPTSQPSSHPSGQPTRQPTSQPSKQPSVRPSSPSNHPTCQPSRQPSNKPSSQPSRVPTSHPSSQPSSQPGAGPTSQPSCQPSTQPSGHPSMQPSRQPTVRPSSLPTKQPSAQPSKQPSGQPSSQPTKQPTEQPNADPSSQPSASPSGQPSDQPTSKPSGQPSKQPSRQPTTQPSGQPSGQPSRHPTAQPSCRPSVQPTARPSTNQPSGKPSSIPSKHPSSRPSSQPTSVPSARPSGQPTAAPSALPSAVPSGAPSTQPTSQPSTQPSTQSTSYPSSQPSSRPSTQPTSQPSGDPSSQPSSLPSSAPSAQPTSAPSACPSTRPTSRPSAQPVAAPSSPPSTHPSSQPSTQPTNKPSAQPSGQPTCQPSGQPSAWPTLTVSTGEWVLVDANSTRYQVVALMDDDLWLCAGSARATTCNVLGKVEEGGLSSACMHYNFVVSGRASDLTASDVAMCTLSTAQLVCDVSSFASTSIFDTTRNPYGKRLIHVGLYAGLPAALITDPLTSTVRSYVYTTSAVRTLTLLHAASPVHFVGSMVAGTSVSAGNSAYNQIVCGWMRSDTGQLSAMSIVPTTGSIYNNVGLVNALAMDSTGPDSFIGGGIDVGDRMGVCACLLRANALFSTISFGVRYLPHTSGTQRRLSTTSSTYSTVVRGLVLVEEVLFVLVEHHSVASNTTSISISVLKTRAATGAIMKQAHVSSLNASLYCTQMLLGTSELLYMSCSIEYVSETRSALILTANRDLSFAALPAGFTKHYNSTLWTENVHFRRSVLPITSAKVNILTTSYVYTTAGSAPSLKPSAPPSVQPSSQPSSTPSAQPSTNPTAAPTVSARPTSVPSTGGPTNTHRPSVAPTCATTFAPTRPPTTSPSARPTARPTVLPTSPPRVSPSLSPTALPSTAPTRHPSSRPTRRPASPPSVTALTQAPSAQVTVQEVDAGASSNDGRISPYIVGYALFKYTHYRDEEKERAVRKVAFFARQAELVEAMHQEHLRIVAEEILRMEEVERRKSQRAVKEGRGAHAMSPRAALPQITAPYSQHTSDSSVILSSLHSSEKSSVHYSALLGGDTYQNRSESWESAMEKGFASGNGADDEDNGSDSYSDSYSDSSSGVSRTEESEKSEINIMNVRIS